MGRPMSSGEAAASSMRWISAYVIMWSTDPIVAVGGDAGFEPRLVRPYRPVATDGEERY
jgi:hypothetical protein